jgi:hypothetical protein
MAHVILAPVYVGGAILVAPIVAPLIPTLPPALAVGGAAITMAVGFPSDTKDAPANIGPTLGVLSMGIGMGRPGAAAAESEATGAAELRRVPEARVFDIGGTGEPAAVVRMLDNGNLGVIKSGQIGGPGVEVFGVQRLKEGEYVGHGHMNEILENALGRPSESYRMIFNEELTNPGGWTVFNRCTPGAPYAPLERAIEMHTVLSRTPGFENTIIGLGESASGSPAFYPPLPK